MRIFLIAGLGLSFLLAGCAIPKPEANPDKYIDYRSTSELLEKQAALTVSTAAYVKRGAPDKMTNRQKLGSLSDEIAANQLRQLGQVERELAKRYHEGDKRAYFEGIDKVPLENPPST